MHVLVAAGLDAFAVVGGIAALASGFLAAIALVTDGSRRTVASAVTYGVAIGGIWGVPLATALFFLELTGLVK